MNRKARYGRRPSDRSYGVNKIECCDREGCAVIFPPEFMVGIELMIDEGMETFARICAINLGRAHLLHY